MRVALVVVLFAFIACSYAAITISSSSGAADTPNPGYILENVVGDVTFTVACDGAQLENCSSSSTWTVNPALSATQFSITQGDGGTTFDEFVIRPEFFSNPTLFTLTFTAVNNTAGGPSLAQSVIVVVSGQTVYTGQPDVDSSWVATKITNRPSRNLQWTPSNTVTFGATAPYTFIDMANPAGPTVAPTVNVPLYWGNSYEIRLGLVSANGRYCGSAGTWPAATNDDDVAPTSSATGFDTDGCEFYLEAGDAWTFPAPMQKVENRIQDAVYGYDTIVDQIAAADNILTDGPLVWTVRGAATAAPAPLVFTGAALTSATWVASCAPAINGQTDPQFPCIQQRYNPDPQVWVVSATGVQPTRITAIGATVTPNHAATPQIPLSRLRQTNEFPVLFVWPNIVTAATGTGVPAQQPVIRVPTCAGASFAPDDPARTTTTVLGVQYFPTCNQGLLTQTGCTPSATVINCVNSTDAGTAGAAIAAALQAASPSSALAGIFLSQRPLQILPNGNDAVLNQGNAVAATAAMTFDSRQGTLPFTIGLPLDAVQDGRTGVLITDNYWSFGANSSTNNGVITITPRAVFECRDSDTAATCLSEGANPAYVAGTLSTFFGGAAPTLTVSNANPTATLSFASLPQPSDGNFWHMFFEVTDAASPSNNGNAWSSLPYITIQVTQVDVEWVNFPPDDDTFYITQPQSANTGSYNYQMRIERSPRSLGLSSIVIDYEITGAPGALIFVVNGTVQTGSFTFTEYQTVLNIQVYTSQSAVGPFSITFTDPLAGVNDNGFLALNLDVVDLYVRANPISVKTQQQSRLQGPYAGEPFWFELTWSPPASGTFTITASGASIAETTRTANVAVTDTGVLLGPITPILPLNIPLDAASYSLPIALRIDGTTQYSVPSIVSVTVFRHTFVVTNALNSENANNGEIELFTTGERSRPYCVSTLYPLFNSTVVSATDSVTLTFASFSSGERIPGLIFEPATLVLSQATPRACVTIRADRSFNWDSLGGGDFDYSVFAYLGGSLAYMFQNPVGVGSGDNIWDFPHDVTVSPVSLHIELDKSKLVAAADTYALGETVQLRVYADVLPSVGLNYTIFKPPGVNIVPSIAGTASTASHGRFAPTAAGAPGQWQAWDVTFTGFAGDIETTGTFNRQVQLTVYLSSGDAQFYRDSLPDPLLGQVTNASAIVSIIKRTVEVEVDSSSVQIDRSFTGHILLDHPVVSGLNVTLVARSSNGVSSTGLSFSPANLVFTPGSPNTAAFTITGNLLGDFEWRVLLSGADADLFDLDDTADDTDSDWSTVTVEKRTKPVFSDIDSASDIAAGATYGPVGLTFPSPLLLGESVTITPSGSDFTFSPASITLNAGQSQALFSFVYSSPTGATSARVFWSVTGPTAWKYDYLATDLVQEYDIQNFAIDFGVKTTTVLAGVAHEGYITLPFPVTSDLVVTPLALGASVTFSPAQFIFTPATGSTIHFTFTVNAVQAFQISSFGTDGDIGSTTAASITISLLANGTAADLFGDAFTAAAVTFTVVRPAFFMEFAVGANNAKEQSNNLYVVGKWSPWFSVYLRNAPASASVTLTISDSKNVIDFQVDNANNAPANSASLVYGADSYLQKLRFRFNNLLSEDSTTTGGLYGLVSVSVSGANAVNFDYSSIVSEFASFQVIPALAISPIPAIYTDGAAHGLFAAVKDSTGKIGGWPYAVDAQFTLHIVPTAADVTVSGTTGVVIEPSTLEFSSSKASDPVQSFSIIHTNPRVFRTARSYRLSWFVRFAGSATAIDITSVVPQDAQKVLLSRYQIIPKFPHVLSYGWQKASFNLSHIPVAHISLTPRIPVLDGANPTAYGFGRGATTPGGRVDFDPPVIVAAPGQQVVEFMVKAQPGLDRDNLYYRVDWELQGHNDDLVNFVEWLQGTQAYTGLNSGGDNAVFATWHIASASLAQVSVAVLLLASAIALLF